MISLRDIVLVMFLGPSILGAAALGCLTVIAVLMLALGDRRR